MALLLCHYACLSACLLSRVEKKAELECMPFVAALCALSWADANASPRAALIKRCGRLAASAPLPD